MRNIIEIISEIEDATNISISCRSRKRDYVICRSIVITYLREMGFSLLYIGKLFNLHHSTVIHATRWAPNDKENALHNKYFDLIMPILNKLDQQVTLPKSVIHRRIIFHRRRIEELKIQLKSYETK